jgi:hypothetical protein
MGSIPLGSAKKIKQLDDERVLSVLSASRRRFVCDKQYLVPRAVPLRLVKPFRAASGSSATVLQSAKSKLSDYGRDQWRESPAFRRRALSVRFIFLAISGIGVRAFECVLSSRTSSLPRRWTQKTVVAKRPSTNLGSGVRISSGAPEKTKMRTRRGGASTSKTS